MITPKENTPAMKMQYDATRWKNRFNMLPTHTKNEEEIIVFHLVAARSKETNS